MWITESKMLLSYTWKRIKKLNSLVVAMDSITLIPPTIAPWISLKIISLEMKQLIDLKISVTGYSFVSTVAANKECFTQSEIGEADHAQLLQVRIGWPSDQDYKRYLFSNQINNYKPPADNISTGAAIYGPLVPILQGKTTRR